MYCLDKSCITWMPIGERPIICPSSSISVPTPCFRSLSQGLAYLGLELDVQRHETHARVISSTQSVCCVRVVPTNEELMIARHTCALLFPGASAGG